uniref:Uncharacterized protein n=1 Tax=Timema monikensis TaxID=170555 RepID=A0A7R9EHI6_9NEOP|nr:unnamed protein product [Timema monikensis]
MGEGGGISKSLCRVTLQAYQAGASTIMLKHWFYNACILLKHVSTRWLQMGHAQLRISLSSCLYRANPLLMDRALRLFKSYVATNSLSVPLGVWPLDLDVRRRAALYWLKKGARGKVEELTREGVTTRGEIREALLDEWQEVSGAANISLISVGLNPIDLIWTNRPPYAKQPAFVHDLKYAGNVTATQPGFCLSSYQD